ncbi:MAG: hypothetical protein AB8G14_17985 [Ilumatobacter sp.]
MTDEPASTAAGSALDLNPAMSVSEFDEVDEFGDGGEQPPSDADATPDRTWERRDWIAVAALMFCSVLLVSLHARAYTTLSPIDELQHVDFTIKAGDFEPPRVNDLVGFEAMVEAACRGVDAPQYIGPLCGLDEYDPEDFQENGVNTAAGQFPFYYTATGVSARAIVATGVLDSKVTAARIVGGVWAGAAWAVMWYVLALLRIPRLRRVIALATMVVTPLTLFHAATVNADSILMFTGALAVLAAIKFEMGRLNGWLLLIIYAALYFVEPTNILAMAASAAYLVVRVSWQPGASTVRRVIPLVVFPMALLLRLSVARDIQRFFFPASPRTLRPTMFRDNTTPDGVVWDKLLAQLDNLFTPVNNAFVPPFMSTQQTGSLMEVTDWLLIGAMFLGAVGVAGSALRGSDTKQAPVLAGPGNELDDGPVVSSPTPSDALLLDHEAAQRSMWLIRFGMLTLIAAGPFYTFSFAYFSQADFDAPARFALPLIVFLVVGLASALRTRWATAMVGSVLVLSAANTLWLLVSA